MNQKTIIYQVLPRLFGNITSNNIANGSIEENGVGKFANFSTKALSEIKKMGFTHIWYTGIIEHATKTDFSAYGITPDNPDIVKGNAGSPYAIKDYYDVSPALASNVEKRMDEFEELVDRSHKAGLKVIIDFVPNHVARQYKSDRLPRKAKDLGENEDTSQFFATDNNFYYFPEQPLQPQFELPNGYNEFPAKATGNDKFDPYPGINDWYETVKINYGVDYLNGGAKNFTPIPDTWLKMFDILSFWAGKDIDGFRCDMVEMVPVEFWNWVIRRIKAKHKNILFIGESYNPSNYRDYIHSGFDYLYDKVGLYDTLKAVIRYEKPVSDITFCWQQLEGIQKNMLNFMENHDEQRIASDFFAKDPKRAIPAMIVSATMNTNPVMLYAGQELGERGMDQEGFSGLDGRTTIFDYWSVETLRNWYNNGKFGISQLSPEQIELRNFYSNLFNLCNKEKALYSGSFYDLTYANTNSESFNTNRQFAYLRCFENELLLVVCNFSEYETSLKVNIPQEAFDFLKIDTKNIKKYKDLLTKESESIDNEMLNSGIPVVLLPYSGKILKF